MHRTLLLLICLCGYSLVAAQQLPAAAPSGILIDPATDRARLEAYNGSTAANRVTPAIWRQAIFQLRHASDSGLGWNPARQVADESLRQAPRGTIPLGLVWARYDRLQADRGTRSQEVFAFTPLRPVTYHGAQTTFTLPASSLLSHAAVPIIGLQLDAGDGRGFQPFDATAGYRVSYATTGSKTLQLRATLADGSSRLAVSELYVRQLATPEPTQTWSITASQTYEGQAGSGQAYLYLADGHAQLTNPLVVVEGFDIDNSMDWPVLYDLLNRQNLLEDLRAGGHDLVVLDFTEAVDPIQRNAFVLTELLQQVNAVAPAGQSNVLVGASMGGLVARYALLWMEQQNIPHQARSFISFDSPHSGANIPLGLQEWVALFAGEAEEAEYLASRLNAPAARQMLLYHLESTVGTTAAADPLMAALNAELSSMGNWPQQTRRVSIINGSSSQADQGFDAGDQLIIYEYRSFLVDIDGDVWAVPDGGSQLIFDGRIDPLVGSSSSKQVTIAGTLPWDSSPGGSRNSMQQLADSTAPYGDIVATHDSHSFIPTVSALALNSNDPFYDVAGDQNLLQNTPFQQVYFPVANQEHIDINPENKLWFVGEIPAGIHVSPISGDTTEGGGTATFTIAALSPPTAPVTIPLSSSDPGEGSVTPQVVLPAGTTAAQLITVTGLDDADSDGNQPYLIVTGSASSADKAYAGRNPSDVAVINRDDDHDIILMDGFESEL